MNENYPSFVDEHPLHNAFLGYQILRLMEVLGAQGEELYSSNDLSFPHRASSTILLISESSGLSTADIARELQQPHQLATQRVELLVKLGLLKRRIDRKDARRMELVLTKKGEAEANRLRQTLHQADCAFKKLYKEIGIDLSKVVIQTKEALEKKSLMERITGKDSHKNQRI